MNPPPPTHHQCSPDLLRNMNLKVKYLPSIVLQNKSFNQTHAFGIILSNHSDADTEICFGTSFSFVVKQYSFLYWFLVSVERHRFNKTITLSTESKKSTKDNQL